FIFSGECLSYIDSNSPCDIYALSSILPKMYAICFYDKNTQLGYSELLDVDCKEILYFMLVY
ncbi:hypothetical protein K450DRAFT_263449, partial [Umbelopsis ramanniana AG]